MSNLYDVFVHYLVYLVGFVAIGIGRLLYFHQTGNLDLLLSAFLIISGICILIGMLIIEVFMIRTEMRKTEARSAELRCV